jgi:hypothetical protein
MAKITQKERDEIMNCIENGGYIFLGLRNNRTVISIADLTIKDLGFLKSILDLTILQRTGKILSEGTDYIRTE